MGFRSFAQAEGERRTPTMRTVLKLLHRLERRFGLEVESEDTQRLRVRLENARRRCGSPAPSQECLAGLRGMTIPQILNSGRQRARAHGQHLSPNGPSTSEIYAVARASRCG